MDSYYKDSIVCNTLQHYTNMFDDILNDREIHKLNELKDSPLLERASRIISGLFLNKSISINYFT